MLKRNRRPTPGVPMYPESSHIVTVCVDPGITASGFAIFPGRLGKTREAIPPFQHGVVKPDSAGGWESRSCSVVRKLMLELGVYIPRSILIVEFPQLWGGSAKSYASASRGDLMKLAFMVGQLCWIFRNRPLGIVTPGEWKGNMSKSVVNARIKRALGEVYPDHVSDAVGMGLFLQEQL